ncbi:MAG TPA: bifunctional ADP-heptose synthase [Gemmatimonadales bacterium]|nr:bifunctional ADP-heptose synthase [Gemmatimonadales bacterium]
MPAPARALPALLEAIQAFPRRRVLVVGDLVADHYLYGETDRISREAPVLVVRYESAEVKLGGGANAAANVRGLGGQVTAVGLIGRDEMGRELRRLFRAAGVRVASPGGEGVETQTKTRILAGGLNTTRQQVLRLDRGGRGATSARLQMELSRLIRAAARDADAVLVSDYGAGVLGEPTRRALRRLADEGLPVCVDSRFDLRAFKGFPVLKPNEPELEALIGGPLRAESDLLAAGREAVKLLSCRAMVVTRGRSGMAIFDANGGAELLPAHGPSEAVDVTGAGDTVMAALTLSLATGSPVADAARIANVAGALVVQKPGTATVARAELVRELESPR